MCFSRVTLLGLDAGLAEHRLSVNTYRGGALAEPVIE